MSAKDSREESSSSHNKSLPSLTMAFWLDISSFMSIEFIPSFSVPYSYYEVQDTSPILLILRLFILQNFFSSLTSKKNGF